VFDWEGVYSLTTRKGAFTHVIFHAIFHAKTFVFEVVATSCETNSRRRVVTTF
jgi:hypothetical protein